MAGDLEPAQRAADGKWLPGASGNPSGRSPVVKAVIELARVHTEDAIAALHEIAMDTKAQAMARVRAAEVLLLRGWGSPVSEVDLPSLLDRGPIRIRFNLGEVDPETVEFRPEDIEDGEFSEADRR